MLNKKKKQAVIKKFAAHDGDTGSSQVQIAILTEEVKELAEHLKTHKKDFSSRRGLLRKVNLRRKLLKYLSKDDPKAYDQLVKKLKIKKKLLVTELDKQAENNLDEIDNENMVSSEEEQTNE